VRGGAERPSHIFKELHLVIYTMPYKESVHYVKYVSLKVERVLQNRVCVSELYVLNLNENLHLTDTI
jgi:hypothetical protein